MYLVVWDFAVKSGWERELESPNLPGGAWPQLFSRDPNYLGTEVVRLTGEANRYLTLDRWHSRESYLAFQDSNRAEYQALDDRLSSLTRSERLLGTFEVL